MWSSKRELQVENFFQGTHGPIGQRPVGLDKEVAHFALPAFIHFALCHARSSPLENPQFPGIPPAGRRPVKTRNNCPSRSREERLASLVKRDDVAPCILAADPA